MGRALGLGSLFAKRRRPAPKSLLLFVALLLAARLPADVITTTAGQRMDNVRVLNLGADDDDDEYYEFEIETVANGKLTGELRRIPEEDVESIEFREPEDPPTVLGRVAHVIGMRGDPLNHMIVERAERTADGLVFWVRKGSEPQGAKPRRAKLEDIYAIRFAPAMMETVAGGAKGAQGNEFMARGPFPMIAYLMTVAGALAVAGAFIFLGTRKKKPP